MKPVQYSELIGMTVIGYALSPDRKELILRTNGECNIVMRAFGSCCSETWIESIDNPNALIGTIASIEDINMPDLGNVGTPHHEDVEEVSYYGLKICTDKGACVLDYRNDSNGYYGGSIDVFLD